MKTSFFPLLSAFRFALLASVASASIFGFCGCGASPQVAIAPTAQPTSAPTKTPVLAVPTAPLKTVQSGRSSLPTLPQMMGNEPRPTFVPLPTPIRTIIISNARPTPAPRENPTIIISNAPVAGTEITPQVAAARGLVWANTKTMIYHRPGSQFFGGTQDGYYISESQAQGRGFRAALR